MTPSILLATAALAFSGDPSAEARLLLSQVQKRIEADTADRAARTERLRLLYLVSVGTEDSLPPAESALDWLRRRGAIAPDLVDAYSGAFEVVRAKHGLWPPAKLDALKRARPLLDGAVSRSPDQVEIRYLRLMSCYYLPSFFGRSWSVREDFAALARLLPASSASFPPGLVARVGRFVLEHGGIVGAERERLVRTVAEAREGASRGREGAR